MVKLTEDMVVARSKGADLHNIKKLNCWGSDLTDVTVVKKLPNVEVLSLSVNKISTLEDFQYCNNLQELYIRKNNIKDINDVLYLRHLPKLKSLWLSDNPCAEFTQYRMTVLRALPHLQKLDNVAVEPEEVQQSMASGRSLPLVGTSFKGSESDLQDNVYSPVSSEASPPAARHPQSANGYGYTTKLYDEDDETPLARSQSYTTEPESSQISPQQRSRYYESHRRSYADYEDDKASVASSQYYNNQRRQSYAGNGYRQVRQSPQRCVDPPEPEMDRSYARQSDYREDSLPPRSDSAQPNCTNSPFSPDSNDNNWGDTSASLHISRDVREQTWANENGVHTRRESSQTDRMSSELRSPAREIRNFNRFSLVSDDGHGYDYRNESYSSNRSSTLQSPSVSRPFATRPKSRNANVLSAVLLLIKELDMQGLEVADTAIRCRIAEMED